MQGGIGVWDETFTFISVPCFPRFWLLLKGKVYTLGDRARPLQPDKAQSLIQLDCAWRERLLECILP